MRKGRSQRKTRGSLPPTSKRPPSRPLLDGAGASAGPQVVVGLTAPRSEESLDTRAAESERLELVRERSLEIVRESLELVREELQERDAQFEQEAHADTNVDAAPVETRAETLSFDPPETFHDAPDSGPGAQPVTVRPSVRVNEETHDEEPIDASPLPGGRVHGPSLTVLTPDEMSIPPVGDLSVEPIADRFFSEGELVAARVHGNDESEDWDQRAHKSVRKSLPEVVQRRARFAKYVRWAVGGAAVVCLAALARTAVPPSASGSGERASAARASLEAAPVAATVSPEAPVAPPVEKAAAAEVVQAPDSVAAPVVAVPTAEPTPAPTPAAAAGGDEKTALQEKNDSRRALERGKIADAIAAGERSVALDPTDGEAWLLLGAAYQEKGNNAEARRCYSSCIKEGKRGPVGECRAMIR